MKYYAAINILEKNVWHAKMLTIQSYAKNIYCIYIQYEMYISSFAKHNTFHMYMHRGKNEGNELKHE